MIVPKLRQPHMDILGAVYVNPKGTKHEPPNVAMKPWLHRSNVVTPDTRPIALERKPDQVTPSDDGPNVDQQDLIKLDIQFHDYAHGY